MRTFFGHILFLVVLVIAHIVGALIMHWIVK
jgi:hypothetical protein